MKFDESLLYNIKSDYRGIRYSLFDLAIWKNGIAFKKIDFSDKGLPVIKIAELNNGISSNTSFTQGDYGKEFFVQWDDLLFSWSGNPQTSIDVFRYRLPDGWLNQHIFKVTANSELVTKDFLYYTLKYLKPYFTQIAINKQTTGLGHVTIADLKRMSVVIPKKEIQEQVTSILKVIDDKIEVNSNINENLEQQAQAIFANEFLSLESLPDGWKRGSLIDIADYLNGLAMQKYRPAADEVGIPVLKIKELRQGCCDATSELCSPNIKTNYIIHDGDVIFSWSGSLLVDFWCGGTCGLNQHLFKVTSSEYDKWFYYAWTKHHLERFIAVAADKATTMGHIKRDELSKAEVLIPNEADYNRIGSLLHPIYDLIITNRIESKNLAETRDTLLPKLMSGEIDISEVDYE